MGTSQEFSWDEIKAKSNLLKHEVSFEEAAAVFMHPDAITEPDDSHSWDEQRFRTIGFSSEGKLVVVVHSDWYETIRLISARPATKNEAYEYAKHSR